MARATHSTTAHETEIFVHPETKATTSTVVPRRLPAETLRLQQLAARIDPVRHWTIDRLINGRHERLSIEANSAAEAKTIADAIHASRQVRQ